MSVLGAVIGVLLCIFYLLAFFTIRKAWQSLPATGVETPQLVVPTAVAGVETYQPVIPPPPTATGQEGQPATAPEVLPPQSVPTTGLAGQYNIVVETGEHPNGTLAYSSSQICGGGCGSYKGIIGLRALRVIDASTFVLDIDVNVTEFYGDPWIFQGDLGDITLEVNGQQYRPTASSFPEKVTGVGSQTGYLTFSGQIPLADQSYKVALRMATRMAQPVEGWLGP